MRQRAQKAYSRQQDASGGNVLFTLGLVSVVALLIVGYIMTRGGFSSLGGSTSDGLNALNILQPTAQPTKVPTVVPTQPVAAFSPSDGGVTTAEIELLKAQYEEKLRLERESADKRVEELRKKHKSELTDLNVQLEILKEENKRLSGVK